MGGSGGWFGPHGVALPQRRPHHLSPASAGRGKVARRGLSSKLRGIDEWALREAEECGGQRGSASSGGGGAEPCAPGRWPAGDSAPSARPPGSTASPPHPPGDSVPPPRRPGNTALPPCPPAACPPGDPVPSSRPLGDADPSPRSLRQPRSGERPLRVEGRGTVGRAPRERTAASLSEVGLPPAVAAAYAASGVSRLYPWQGAALECGRGGCNLVYCAPTSGGKSLVAEVLLALALLGARPVTSYGGPGPRTDVSLAMFVVPYVSVVREKEAHLGRVLSAAGLAVKGYAGGSESGEGRPLAPGAERVAVLTPEKANVAVGRLIREGRVGDLACLVLDEVHMISDEGRGLAVELLVTKLLAAQQATVPQAPGAAARGPPTGPARPVLPAAPPRPRAQIVAMSATIGGVETLAEWMDARLFLTDFRPVALDERLVCDGDIFEVVGRGARRALVPGGSVRDACGEARDGIRVGAAAGDVGGGGGAGKGTFASSPPRAGRLGTRERPSAPRPAVPSCRHDSTITRLVEEATASRQPTLVFCPTKRGCEALARRLAETLPPVPLGLGARLADEPSGGEGTPGPGGGAAALPPRRLLAARLELLERVRLESGSPACDLLRRTVPAGVAFHHAGLAAEEREAVEHGFRAGLILALAATSTLAAGVNLPAWRVILDSHRAVGARGMAAMPRAQYLQMIGRAGRAGFAEHGTSFLVVQGDRGGGRRAPLSRGGENARGSAAGGGRSLASGRDGEGTLAPLSPRSPPARPLAAIPADAVELVLAPLPRLRSRLLLDEPAPPAAPAAPALDGPAASDPLIRPRLVPLVAGVIQAAASPIAMPAPPLKAPTVKDGPSEPSEAVELAREQRENRPPPSPAGGLGPRAGAPETSRDPSVVGHKASAEPPPARGPPRRSLFDPAGLQRLVVEGIGCGLVETPNDVVSYLGCTLAAQQADPGQLRAECRAAMEPLFHGRDKLMALERSTAGGQDLGGAEGRSREDEGAGERPQDSGSRSNASFRFKLHARGRAIFDSGLPKAEGERLYAQLAKLQDGLALSCPTHLIFSITLGHPCKVLDWRRWHAVLERERAAWELDLRSQLGGSGLGLPGLGSGRAGEPRPGGGETGEAGEPGPGGTWPRDRGRGGGVAARPSAPVESSPAELAGVRARTAWDVAFAGRPLAPGVAELHARWAAARLGAAMAEEGGHAAEVSREWGAPGFLSDSGLSTGDLQKLAADLEGWAGMAALTAASAGWAGLAAVLDDLSSRLRLGGAPREAASLVTLPGVTPSRARALCAAGICNPAALATADVGAVGRALLAEASRRVGADRGRRAAAAAAAAAGGPGRRPTTTRAAAGLARRNATDLVRAAREAVAGGVGEPGVGGAGPESGAASAREGGDLDRPRSRDLGSNAPQLPKESRSAPRLDVPTTFFAGWHRAEIVNGQDPRRLSWLREALSEACRIAFWLREPGGVEGGPGGLALAWDAPGATGARDGAGGVAFVRMEGWRGTEPERAPSPPPPAGDLVPPALQPAGNLEPPGCRAARDVRPTVAADEPRGGARIRFATLGPGGDEAEAARSLGLPAPRRAPRAEDDGPWPAEESSVLGLAGELGLLAPSPCPPAPTAPLARLRHLCQTLSVTPPLLRTSPVRGATQACLAALLLLGARQALEGLTHAHAREGPRNERRVGEGPRGGLGVAEGRRRTALELELLEQAEGEWVEIT